MRRTWSRTTGLSTSSRTRCCLHDPNAEPNDHSLRSDASVAAERCAAADAPELHLVFSFLRAACIRCAAAPPPRLSPPAAAIQPEQPTPRIPSCGTVVPPPPLGASAGSMQVEILAAVLGAFADAADAAETAGTVGTAGTLEQCSPASVQPRWEPPRWEPMILGTLREFGASVVLPSAMLVGLSVRLLCSAHFLLKETCLPREVFGAGREDTTCRGAARGGDMPPRMSGRSIGWWVDGAAPPPTEIRARSHRFDSEGDLAEVRCKHHVTSV